MKLINVFTESSMSPEVKWILKDINIDELRHILDYLSRSTFACNCRLMVFNSDSLESCYYEGISKLELVPELVLCSWLNN